MAKNKSHAKKRGQRAAKAARAQAAVDEAAEVAAAEPDAEKPCSTRMTAVQEERRRQMIVGKFESMGSPPESMWDGPAGTVSKIAEWLPDFDHRSAANMDRRPIRRTLQRLVADEPLAISKCGRPRGEIRRRGGRRWRTPRPGSRRLARR